MNWLDKHQEKILIFTWTLIILTSLFVIFTSPVKASSPSSLPYVTSTGFNSVPDSEVQNVLSLLQSTYPNDDFSNILVFKTGSNAWWNWSTNTTVPGYNVFVFPDDSCVSSWVGSNGGSSFDDFVLYDDDFKIRLSLSGCYQYTYIHREIGDYYWKSPVLSGENFLWVFGDSTLTEINTIFNFTYNDNYPVYSNFSLITTDTYSHEGVIISPISNSNPDLNGHAQPPVDENGHYIDDGNGDRIPKPNFPNIQGHSPSAPQFPSIDTSSLEALVESLIDIVKYSTSYLVGVISDSFSNLLSNLGSLFNFVVQSIYYAVNNIVGAIKDLATTIYNNFASLFESVATFFNNLIAIGTIDEVFSIANIFTYLFIPDSGTLYPIFVSHDEFNIIGITNHLFSQFRNFLSSVENVNSLHYIMLPSFTFHGAVIPQTRIDFSWYDDYKVYGDGIISAFLIVGYIYFLFTRISGWLRGNQGDIYVGDNSSNYHDTKIGF